MPRERACQARRTTLLKLTCSSAWDCQLQCIPTGCRCSVPPIVSSRAQELAQIEIFPAGNKQHRGYGATAARLTPDQKVGSSNLSALIHLLDLSSSVCCWPSMHQASSDGAALQARSCNALAGMSSIWFPPSINSPPSSVGRAQGP